MEITHDIVKMKHIDAVLYVRRYTGWSKSFAGEYVVARRYHGMSHAGAIREAKRSPHVAKRDIPAGV